jgi:ribosomal protein S12 methylthiotransferase
MRGRHRSFGADDLIREAQLLELQGAREVNLVAQDLAHYGRDLRTGEVLPHLLQRLLAETGIPWFRLLYIYSAGLTEAMLELLAREPRLVRYLDIPMQHAADTVLARMRRPERKARQRERLARIRDLVPGVAIRSTVIVGFPGESDAEFRELLDFLEEVQLERVGVFTYSPQEGTRAAAMPDDVPDELKRERADQVQQLQRAITAERYEQLMDRVVPAMVDRAADAGARSQARIYAQADDIDGVTWVETPEAPGTLLDVRITGVIDDHDFSAEVVRVASRVTESPAPVRRALPMAPQASAYTYGKPWPA